VAEYLGILNDMSLFYCWRLFVIWVTGALAPVVISAVWWVTCQEVVAAVIGLVTAALVCTG
jgi:hypothetical protein